MQTTIRTFGAILLLASQLVHSAPATEFSLITQQGNETLSATRFIQAGAASKHDKPFIYLEGQDLGLEKGFMYGLRDYTDPFWFGRGTASGDYDRDGWQDILLAGNQGFYLYRNEGGRFALQKLPSSTTDIHEIFAIAFVDMNNDGWLDIFYTTFNQGNFLILNQEGQFKVGSALQVPNNQAALTLSPGFADIDGDGYLDILNGNIALGVVTGFHHMRARRNNSIVFNGGLRFRDVEMETTSGETMATLISDFNNDNIADIYFGNDFYIPDKILLGTGRGYKEVKGNRFVPFTPFYSMGADSGDVNNDLVPDFVAMGTMNTAHWLGRKDIDGVASIEYTRYKGGRESCEGIRNKTYRENCVHVRSTNYVETLNQQRLVNYRQCLSTNNRSEKELCLTETMWRMITHAPKTKDCAAKYPGDIRLSEVCEILKYRDSEYDRRNIYGAIPQDDRNMLYTFDKDRGSYRYVNGFKHPGGWTWNTRIVDLDNDGWQDVFNADGAIRNSGYGWNVFMKNIDGQRFEQRQFSYGLVSDFGLYSFTLVDYDNDGDLDVIGNSAEGPVQVYRNNNTQTNNSIAVSLRDNRGNRFGIGAKITIRYANNNAAQMREIKASGGYQSFDAPIAWFGLGKYNKIESIQVHWPDNKISEFRGELKTGMHYRIDRR